MHPCAGAADRDRRPAVTADHQSRLAVPVLDRIVGHRECTALRIDDNRQLGGHARSQQADGILRDYRCNIPDHRLRILGLAPHDARHFDHLAVELPGARGIDHNLRSLSDLDTGRSVFRHFGLHDQLRRVRQFHDHEARIDAVADIQLLARPAGSDDHDSLAWRAYRERLEFARRTCQLALETTDIGLELCTSCFANALDQDAAFFLVLIALGGALLVLDEFPVLEIGVDLWINLRLSGCFLGCTSRLCEQHNVFFNFASLGFEQRFEL